MHVCVDGLSHLGTVTAACLASGGHAIIGRDDNSSGPGLADLIRAGATVASLTQVSA